MRIPRAVFLLALSLPIAAGAIEAPGSVSPEGQAGRLAAEYRAQQVRRLATLGDRDSLIAAALVGLADETGGAPVAGHDAVLGRLLAEHEDDPLALYAAALACQESGPACGAAQAPAKLLRVAPGNAVHWLVQARGAPVDRALLHSAAETAVADSHHGALLGIVRAALAGQPSPTAPEAGVDAHALALALRRRVTASLPWPAYGAAMGICSAKAAQQGSKASADQDSVALRTDCANLGHALFSDQGLQVVTRMYGSTLLRRFAPNTHLASEALAFRRQYLWLDQLRIGGSAAARERLDEDSVAHGEWEALQRQAERGGSTREPPPGWQPKDPRALALPEQR